MKHLAQQADEFIRVIEKNCIEVCGRCTPIVMFLKLQGDMARYVAEVAESYDEIDTIPDSEKTPGATSTSNKKIGTKEYYKNKTLRLYVTAIGL